MDSENVKVTPGGVNPASSKKDGNNKNLHIETTSSGKDIIPDEVPRTDGPGGE